MKQDFAFSAARALARHSPALVRPGPGEAELVGAITPATARLARSLRSGLTPFCGGQVPEIAIDPPRLQTLAEFADQPRAIWSSYALTGATDGALVLSAVSLETALRLVDRAFGGPGDAPRPLPREMPLSAEMMVQRIEAIIAAHLVQALDSAALTGIEPLRRDADLAQLAPVASGARLATLTVTVSEGARTPWLIQIALPLALIAALAGQGSSTPRAAAPADPASEPFGTVPLPLTALLIDTRLPLDIVSRLEVGQVLNLPIARQVPLVIGRQRPARTIAHGTIGACDDRVAIQITQLA